MPTNDKDYQREYMRKYRIRQKYLKNSNNKELPKYEVIKSLDKKLEIIHPLPSKVVKGKVVKKVKKRPVLNSNTDWIFDEDPGPTKLERQRLIEICIRMQKFNFPKKDIQLIMELM